MFYLKLLSDVNHMKTTDSSQHCQPVEEKISCDIDSDICSCLFFLNLGQLCHMFTNPIIDSLKVVRTK